MKQFHKTSLRAGPGPTQITPCLSVNVHKTNLGSWVRVYRNLYRYYMTIYIYRCILGHRYVMRFQLYFLVVGFFDCCEKNECKS